MYTIVITNSGSGAQADNPSDKFVDMLPIPSRYSR